MDSTLASSSSLSMIDLVGRRFLRRGLQIACDGRCAQRMVTADFHAKECLLSAFRRRQHALNTGAKTVPGYSNSSGTSGPARPDAGAHIHMRIHMHMRMRKDGSTSNELRSTFNEFPHE